MSDQPSRRVALRMRHQATLFLTTVLLASAAPCWGRVVVISNRTAEPLRFKATSTRSEQNLTLQPGDLTSIACQSPVVVRWSAGDQSGERELPVDAAYYFYRDPKSDELRLEPIGLISGPDRPVAEEAPAEQAETAETNSERRAGGMATFTVKLLADEEERASRKMWEARLRNRLKTASAVFEHYCRVRFETVAVETWKSNDAIADFEGSLADFRERIDLGPARLAIGFTSQYEVPEGRTHLGGTYGPLATHILLREWSQHLSEAERTELLIHELGHFLGAVHSLEADSVMRPMLGDKQAAAKKFRIRFDPLNTLAICLVGDECRDATITSLRDLSRPTRHRLTAIYRTLAELLPEDPAAPQYYLLLTQGELAGFPLEDKTAPEDGPEVEGNQPVRRGTVGRPARTDVGRPARTDVGRPAPTDVGRPATTTEPGLARSPLVDGELPGLVDATRGVLKAIVAAAQANRRLPKGRQAGGDDLFRHEGDGLTEYYVQAAATAALDNVPQRHREKAFLLGLAIGLETSDWLREVPVMGDFLRQIEPSARRRQRLEALGQPTMRGRDDLVQHFMISAALTALAGARSAEAAGVGKELRDADGGSGFSFSDLCADLAGIEFAERIQSGTLPLNRLTRRFRVRNYLPDVKGLADGLSRREFAAQFGSATDARFNAARAEMRQRISGLPAYGKASDSH